MFRETGFACALVVTGSLASLGGCYRNTLVAQTTYAPTYVTQQTTSVSVTANVTQPQASPSAPESAAPGEGESEADNNGVWRAAVRIIRPVSLGYSPVDLNQCLRSPCNGPFGTCRCVYPGQPIPSSWH